MLRERAAEFADPRTAQVELIELAKVFREMVGERRFELQREGLVDTGPDDDWYYPGWEDQLAADCSGALGFFQGLAGTGSVVNQRWAEAQSLRYNLSSFVEGLSAVWFEIVCSSCFLGPLRSVPPRHLLELHLQELQRRGTAGVSSTFEAWIRACEDSQIQETVNRWLGPGCLNTPYRLAARTLVYSDDPGTAVGLPELQFEERSSGVRLGHHDVWFGISRVLPVLVHAAHRSRGIVAVEQPELHLHPALRAELGDVFIESALGERRNTFLLETHSEHLILRILRRVRETTEGKLPDGKTPVRPEDVSVVYVQPGSNGSEVLEMPVTPDGDFGRPWPGGFFAERFQELP
ncbi:MAG: AAA family ATPase [Verrucomicrobia bacterium]|nr:AAA family ATPase [Verrucomicrobiota bacterium]